MMFTCLGTSVLFQIKKMNDIHSQYLKDDHFEEDDEEELNLEPQKTFDNESESPDEELENLIMEQVLRLEKKQDSISAQLQNKLATLLQRINNQSQEQIVKLRMSQLALSKILVYTHGKSEFRLVMAHHHIGKSYLNYKCYQQAIDHLTLALKKNSKLTQIRETKLYHSHILTTLSKCYYEIASYEDALEVLNRAEDIQSVSYSQINQNDKCNVETIRLMANCNTKLKNYKKAHEYIQRAMSYGISTQGEKSKEVSKLKIDKAKIYYEEKNYEAAIAELDRAIQFLIELNYGNKLELVQLEDLLAVYYEKNGDFNKQIETLFAKLELYSEIYDESNKNTLKLKRSIATTLIKHLKIKQAIALLQEILESEEKVYGPTSIHVGKTLKMLGMVYMSNENESNSAEHYLKRAQKILQDQGNTKLLKEIKTKLNTIKQNREKRINVLIHQQ